MRTPAATIPAYLDRFTVGPVPAYRPDLGPCWLWDGARNGGGYGYAQDPSTGRMVGVHRAMYEVVVGPIPDGLQIDHLCRVTGCLRPSHLEPVTVHENLLRSPRTLVSINLRKTHCPHGHALTDDNLVSRHDRRRECKACHCERERRRRRAAVAARRAENIVERPPER